MAKTLGQLVEEAKRLNGIYYDPVGDDIFVLEAVGTKLSKDWKTVSTVHRVDFGDEVKTGIVVLNGYEVRLETL